MAHPDPRIERSAARERPPEADPKKTASATKIILVAVGIAAVLVLGGTYLLVPDRVYDAGESYGTEAPSHVERPAK